MTKRSHLVVLRVIASVTLAAAPPALIGLPLVPTEHQASHCRQSAERAPFAVVTAAPHGGCGHADLGPCQAAVGCSAASVLGLHRAVDAPDMTVVHPDAPGAVLSLFDLYRVGPPTPPPNS